MISLEWVSDYIDLKDQDLKELAVKITKAGINVEKVISNDIPNLVIGKVINCIPHPNSDHMHICEVDVGKEKLVQIVCGASNVKAGIKVIVALEGAKLPGGEIKKTELRGVQSNGMICALCEVGLEENTPWRELKMIGADDVVSVVFENEVDNNCCKNLVDVAFRSFELMGVKENTL